MCALDLVFAKWHDNFFQGDAEAHEHVKQVRAQLDGTFATRHNRENQCPTKFVNIDDESYRHDGMPWSDEAFCAVRHGSRVKTIALQQLYDTPLRRHPEENKK